MAELDAAFFLLYGIGRDDVEYILGTFSSLADTEHEALGVLPQATAILRAYDQMAGLAAQG
jgi:hypothetical protein